MKVAAMLMFIADVHGLGLEAAQGLYLTESFYWDLNERSRAFTKRFEARMPGQKPNMTNAGVYSGVLHWLKAVKDAGAANRADGAAIVARMKGMPVSDDAYPTGTIREDGLVTFPSYLFQVKTPAESKYAWDYFKLVAETPAAEAWKPLATVGCSLVKA